MPVYVKLSYDIYDKAYEPERKFAYQVHTFCRTVKLVASAAVNLLSYLLVNRVQIIIILASDYGKSLRAPVREFLLNYK